MSKRLQVLVSEEELGKYKRVAFRQELSVGEWVRRTLYQAVREGDVKPAEQKLAAIEEAMKLNLPTSDIEQMIRESEEEVTDLPGF